MARRVVHTGNPIHLVGSIGNDGDGPSPATQPAVRLIPEHGDAIRAGLRVPPLAPSASTHVELPVPIPSQLPAPIPSQAPEALYEVDVGVDLAPWITPV